MSGNLYKDPRDIIIAPVVSEKSYGLIDQGKTQRVSVPKPVAVYLLYWTAFAGGSGAMNFREDPYGWDKLLADKIDASTNRAQANATTIASKE